MAEEVENRVSITIRLKPSFVEALRNAAFWIGQNTSVTGILEEGGAEVLKRLEKEFNGGKPFPHRTTELAKRPLKAGRGRRKA